MPWHKHVNSPTWQLAVRVFRTCADRGWRRAMRVWLIVDDPRAKYDVVGVSEIEAAEIDLIKRLAFEEAREMDRHARRLREIDECRAAINRQAEKRAYEKFCPPFEEGEADYILPECLRDAARAWLELYA